MEQSSIAIKSNITLKSRGVFPPMDNMPDTYFEVRNVTPLTQVQQLQKTKMLFWAKDIIDENNKKAKVECYKGCINCGKENNHCKHPQNKKLLMIGRATIAHNSK